MMRSLSFSIIELLIVLSIVMILCSLAIPYTNYGKNYHIGHELDRLYTIIMLLQQQALASGQEKNLYFDESNNSYWFEKKSHKTVFSLNNSCNFGFFKGVLGPPGDPKIEIKKAISFVMTKSKNDIYVMKILPNGISSSGAIYIIDKKNKSMGALTCPLSQGFYMRKYLYNATRWQILTH